jgi:hypothetical protein
MPTAYSNLYSNIVNGINLGLFQSIIGTNNPPTVQISQTVVDLADCCCQGTVVTVPCCAGSIPTVLHATIDGPVKFVLTLVWNGTLWVGQGGPFMCNGFNQDCIMAFGCSPNTGNFFIQTDTGITTGLNCSQPTGTCSPMDLVFSCVIQNIPAFPCPGNYTVTITP